MRQSPDIAQQKSTTTANTEMAGNRCLSSLLILLLASVALEQLVAGSKIAYKKPLYGKQSTFKDKRFKPRAIRQSTTVATTEEDWPVEFVINTTPRAAIVASKPVEPKPKTEPEPIPETDEEFSQSSTMPSTPLDLETEQEQELDGSSTSTTQNSLDNTLPSPPTPVSMELNQPVPCTCGVFLSSQIKNGLPETPLIHNEMDRMYPCNAIGRKQCQTKCLEAIVQHLPNSANIVCATLGHNCHKERAYLFIKNCQNVWVNTNLQAGREYCCNEGKPYRCPLLG